MQLTRRQTVMLGVMAAAAAALPATGQTPADALIADFTGGAATTGGELVLTAPLTAENSTAVPVTVECPGAEAIRILAPLNPTPEICTIAFGPLAGSQRFTTRLRLAESQDLIALARMPDGSFLEARVRIAVTDGGCVG